MKALLAWCGRAGCLAGLALVLTGCGRSSRVGGITGKVHLGTRPLTGGSVTFVGADGTKASSGIGRDGTYRISQMVVGPARIAVVSRTHVPPGLLRSGRRQAKGTAAAEERPVAIPKRYERPESSGLTYTVLKGEQPFDIKLEP
jgi:hypothetical protein